LGQKIRGKTFPTRPGLEQENPGLAGEKDVSGRSQEPETNERYNNSFRV